MLFRSDVAVTAERPASDGEGFEMGDEFGRIAADEPEGDRRMALAITGDEGKDMDGGIGADEAFGFKVISSTGIDQVRATVQDGGMQLVLEFHGFHAGEKLVFAMNAGMFHRDFSAVGLSVSDGKQLTPLNTDKGEGNFFLKPNGVFLVTEKGAQIIEASEYPQLRERAVIATQSGPMLVHRGVIHPAFKAGSANRLFRNGVGVPSPDVALFAITDAPLNFHDFATLFRDKLHCPNALFLDGTISSLHSAELKRSDFRMDLGPILGVTE